MEVRVINLVSLNLLGDHDCYEKEWDKINEIKKKERLQTEQQTSDPGQTVHINIFQVSEHISCAF